MMFHSLEDELIDDPGGLEEWEKGLQEEEEEEVVDVVWIGSTDERRKEEKCPHCFR